MSIRPSEDAPMGAALAEQLVSSLSILKISRGSGDSSFCRSARYTAKPADYVAQLKTHTRHG